MSCKHHQLPELRSSPVPAPTTPAEGNKKTDDGRDKEPGGEADTAASAVSTGSCLSLYSYLSPAGILQLQVLLHEYLVDFVQDNIHAITTHQSQVPVTLWEKKLISSQEAEKPAARRSQRPHSPQCFISVPLGPQGSWSILGAILTQAPPCFSTQAWPHRMKQLSHSKEEEAKTPSPAPSSGSLLQEGPTAA